MALELNGTTGVSLVQDGVVATADLADNAVTSAKLFSGFANGITMVDTWTITSDFDNQTGTSTIVNNWARVSASIPDTGNIGSGMTESSGVFTFPTNGIYLVTAHFSGRTDTSTLTYFGPRIHVSADSGSNYNVRASMYQNSSRTNGHLNPETNVILDVNDSSAFRVYFSLETSEQIDIFGSSSATQGSYFRFIRLGDT